MAKAIRQFRYYGVNDPHNYPNDSRHTIRSTNIVSGSIFNSQSGNITQLGIQTLPGTQFFLNNSENPIIVGYTGIYELDLEGISEITSLKFDSKSVKNIESIDTAYLIVDAIYEEG